ncbi:MAG TPA: hypothetical protein VFG04_25000 [Planctomycetaceae bacterium]|jgi:hypothetical protein|nr:hypothetical protein [Planctomycetaceae bacterium]
MQANGSRFAAWLGTAAVVVHGIPLVLHGMAHAKLEIFLPSVLANAYVLVVLYLAPVVAAGLLWAGRIRSGAWLLVASMVGSLIFEGYNHFLVMSPDHVSQVPAGTWGEIFRVTAVVSAITEVLAVAAGIVILVQSRSATSVGQAQDGGLHSK